MKNTKIVTSLGPSSNDPDVFEQMVLAGANVARINFSHASDEEKVKAVSTVKEVRKRTGQTIAIMYDTKGPELRVGMMENGGAVLAEGNYIRVVKEQVTGNKERFSLNHPQAIDYIKPGHKVLLENGLMELEVMSSEPDGITCKIVKGGTLESRKSVSVPCVFLNLPFMSDADRADIKYACHHDGDFIACSFVSTADDVCQVRRIIEEEGCGRMRIIAKIENLKGIDNIERIIEVSDGVMVARGDLGVEAPMEDLPIYQKRIVALCRKMGKVCIIATEMLESMKHNMRPTRAEVTDIANAVYLGADAVMLSGETTTGEYPVEAVRYMARICEHIEESHAYTNIFAKRKATTIAETMCNIVAESANELKAKVIIVPTKKGLSARLISNLAPICPIYALTFDEATAQGLTLNYGIYTDCIRELYTMDQMLEMAKRKVSVWLGLKAGDIAIITGGFHAEPVGAETNFMRIDVIG
ncbi:MAG: pyruvate kinase [Bacteroidales bacterium]|nr:pyruvate kinase [Candidatus Colimorpha onthohippi]